MHDPLMSTGSQTLPRQMTDGGGSRDDVSVAHSSSSVYDNAPQQPQQKRPDSRTASGSSRDLRQSARGRRDMLTSRSVDYQGRVVASSGRELRGSGGHGSRSGGSGGGHGGGGHGGARLRSKSTDQLHSSHPDCRLDSGTLKKMLKPVHTAPESPVTSPEGGRGGRGHGGGHNSGHRGGHGQHSVTTAAPYAAQNGFRGGGRYDSDQGGGFMSEPETMTRGRRQQPPHQLHHRPRHLQQQQQPVRYPDIGRTSSGNHNFNSSKGVNAADNLYLDFQNKRQQHQRMASPPSDSGGIFDAHCFATTPSSSNGGNSDLEGDGGGGGGGGSGGGGRTTGASPTAQLLMDYEEHLRNTLEKGLDAESYSLHTFEALLTRSMENLGRPSLDCAM